MNSTSLTHWLVMAVGLALLAPACGGSSRQKAEEPAENDVASPVDEDEGGDMIPAEKFDELKLFFDRKRKHLSKCMDEAIAAGEVSKKGSARVTITMTISRSGRPTNVRAAESRPRSPALEKCVVDKVKSWTTTTLPKPLDYSYSYGFGTL